MRRIYTSSNLVQVGQLKQLLTDNRINSFIKNEHLAGGIGELPVFDCWPELWLTDATQFPRATALLEAFLVVEETTSANWTCGSCHEVIEPQFGTCWNCGTDRPDPSPHDHC